MYPTRRASPVPPEGFIGQNLLSGCGPAYSGGSALAALPLFLNVTLRTKNRNIFCLNRIESKAHQRHRKCAPGVSKGGGSGAGATCFSAPLADFFWYFSCSATRTVHYRALIIEKRILFAVRTGAVAPLPLPMGEVPRRGGEGPLRQLRCQLSQRESQGGCAAAKTYIF